MKLLLARDTDQPIYNVDLPLYEEDGFGNTYYTYVYAFEDLIDISDEFSERVTFSFEDIHGEEIIWAIVED